MSRIELTRAIHWAAVSLAGLASCSEPVRNIESTRQALSGPAPALVATAPTPSAVVLTWNDVSGETGYYVDRSTNGGQTFSQLQSLAAGTVTWTDSSPSALTTYCYRVRAYDGAGAQASNTRCVLTPKGYEAESLTRSTSSATATVVTDAAASAGKMLATTASAVGGWVELTLKTPATGVYGTKLRYRASPDAGKFKVTVGGAAYGAEIDGYAATEQYREVYLGETEVTTASTSRILHFELTGRNAASTGNKIQLDAITMYVAQFRYEAESSTPSVSSGDSQSSSSDSSASDGKVNVARLNAVSDYVRYTMAVGAPGTYTIIVRLRAGSDRGRFQAVLDDTTNLGSEVDTYRASTAFTTVSLGSATIASAGSHTIKLRVTGKNSASSSYGITVDDIDLRLVTGAGCELFGDAIPDGTTWATT